MENNLLTATITSYCQKISRKGHKFRNPGKRIGNRLRRRRRGQDGMEEKSDDNINKVLREDANPAVGNDLKTTREAHSPRTGNTEAPKPFPDEATDDSKFEKVEAAKSGGSKEPDAVDLIVARKTGQIQELPSKQTMGNGVSSLSSCGDSTDV
jgi:hypothetical protein